MPHDDRHTIDEALLSGYLDGALTQGDEQRVRLHLEECSECRELLDQMNTIREATMSTRFELPADDGWDERPRSLAARLSRGIGWTILGLWTVGLTGFAVGQLWSGPESLTEKLIVFGGVSGFALLFLSVLLDRLKTFGSDRYRGVRR